MTTFEIAAVLTGALFLFLAHRTRVFNRTMLALRDFPEDLPAGFTPLIWPKVSIVVPACNEADTIEAAAKSLLALDYPNLEVVFVNDRSTDNTGEVINRIANKDPRFKAIHISRLPDGWLGKVHAMARGIESVAGERILMTDADVVFGPTALRKAM